MNKKSHIRKRIEKKKKQLKKFKSFLKYSLVRQKIIQVVPGIRINSDQNIDFYSDKLCNSDELFIFGQTPCEFEERGKGYSVITIMLYYGPKWMRGYRAIPFKRFTKIKLFRNGELLMIEIDLVYRYSPFNEELIDMIQKILCK